MKKVILPLVVLMFVACNSSSSTKDQKPQDGTTKDTAKTAEQVIAEPASVFNLSTTKVGFGAFKTTAKKEVKGWFENFELKGITEADKVEDIFANASISIEVNSLETNNKGRNMTLLTEFFGKTTSSQTIKGKVLSFNPESSIAQLELLFNDVRHEIPFNYSLSGDTLSMTGVLQLEDVNGMEALASINKACEALHKGDDGVSKTWSDVNIYLSTVLNK